MAKQIHETLGVGDRAAAATTIAVIACEDGKTYCFGNDVSSIGNGSEIAKKLGITDDIELAGAGFHAEMWAVVKRQQGKLQQITRVGASQQCCFHCSRVLTILGIQAEKPSQKKFKSWTNPLTTKDDGHPKDDYQKHQRADLPDQRLWSIDYWFVDAAGNTDKKPRGQGAARPDTASDASAPAAAAAAPTSAS